jgi:hypothetical protein
MSRKELSANFISSRLFGPRICGTMRVGTGLNFGRSKGLTTSEASRT